MSETEILRACLEYLSYRGIFCWRSNQAPIPLPGGGFRRFNGLPGVSDILGVLPQQTQDGLMGSFLAVECKTPKGRLSDDQKRFLSEIEKRGGVALVVRSVDELEKQLEDYPFIRF